MNNARRTLTALVVGAFVLAACGGDGASTTTSTVADGDRIRFGSGQYPFALHYPADWEGDTSDADTVIIISSPTTGTDQFFENINVIVSDEAAGFDSVLTYAEANYDTLEAVIPQFEFYEEFEAELGGEPAYVFVYGGVFDGAAIDFFQVFTIHEGLAYVITYTGAGEDFDTYLGVMLDLLDSWEWRD